MSSVSWSIRPATSDDADFLADMLVAVVNWSPHWKRQSRRRVLSREDTARYITGWRRPSDLGSIAVADEPVGAAWLRFFPESRPGYGFVSADVPELTIGVTSRWRGRGVGRALLRSVIERAGCAGIDRISLNVERLNVARDLYLSEGFRLVGPGYESSEIFVRDIAAG